MSMYHEDFPDPRDYCLFCGSVTCPDFPEEGCEDNYKEYLYNEKLAENYQQGVEQSDEEIKREINEFIAKRNG